MGNGGVFRFVSAVSYHRTLYVSQGEELLESSADVLDRECINRSSIYRLTDTLYPNTTETLHLVFLKKIKNAVQKTECVTLLLPPALGDTLSELSAFNFDQYGIKELTSGDHQTREKPVLQLKKLGCELPY
jgi:hypothetical protein